MNAEYFDYDCSKCQGLCCIATYRSTPEFPDTQEVGKPCRNLMGNSQCRIHASLENKFPACCEYSCHSAGNRLTRLLRIGGIPDFKNAKNEWEKEWVRVAMTIFKDLEWIFTIFYQLRDSWTDQERTTIEGDIKTLLDAIEEIVRSKKNTLVAVPLVIDLHAKMVDRKRDKIFSLGILGKNILQGMAYGKEAIDFHTKFPRRDEPNEYYERMISADDWGKATVEEKDQLKKYIFAMFQFAYFYYGKKGVWGNITLTEMLCRSVDATRTYSGKPPGEADTEILGIIFEMQSRNRFLP